VTFALDGKVFAAGDGRGTVYLWKIGTSSPLKTLSDPNEYAVDSLAFSSHGNLLAIGDYNGSGYLWRLAFHRNRQGGARE
jgi:WD40 repeat protein